MKFYGAAYFYTISLLGLIGCKQDGLVKELIPTKHIVEIKKMSFIPNKLIINKGDTVVWINRDIFVHDVTESTTKAWSSSTLNQGESWRLVISSSSDYYCSLHVVMKGKIIVK